MIRDEQGKLAAGLGFSAESRTLGAVSFLTSSLSLATSSSWIFCLCSNCSCDMTDTLRRLSDVDQAPGQTRVNVPEPPPRHVNPVLHNLASTT